MATPKQAVTVVNLIQAARKKNGKPSLTSAEVELARGQALALSHKEIQDLFNRVNAALDYDRFESPASTAQVKLIWQLERSLYGTPRTPAGSLRWVEADAKVKELKAALTDRRAGVRAVEHFANTSIQAVAK